MPFEIERKFVILKPDAEALCTLPEYTCSDIAQTYLLSDVGVTHRVRRRSYCDRTVWLETVKRRVSALTAVEDEREITEEEYLALLDRADPARITLNKRRMTFAYGGLTFEIDLYPQWDRCCIMEVELEREDVSVELPPFISIVREVTGMRDYSNASMAGSFPPEPV